MFLISAIIKTKKKEQQGKAFAENAVRGIDRGLRRYF